MFNTLTCNLRCVRGVGRCGMQRITIFDLASRNHPTLTRYYCDWLQIDWSVMHVVGALLKAHNHTTVQRALISMSTSPRIQGWNLSTHHTN